MFALRSRRAGREIRKKTASDAGFLFSWQSPTKLGAKRMGRCGRGGVSLTCALDLSGVCVRKDCFSELNMRRLGMSFFGKPTISSEELNEILMVAC